jgi:hypothetical protein
LRRPSLRSQLNQIRLWVRQGRTDAWIAHKLDISVEQLEQFKRNHELVSGASSPETAAAPAAGPLTAAELADEEQPEAEIAGAEAVASGAAAAREGERAQEEEVGLAEEDDDISLEDEAAPGEPADREADRRLSEEGERPRRRRRGRRGGRRREARSSQYEGTFDHGDEGYGLWLDPAVADDPIYAEHWAGRRAVTVTLEPDSITIRLQGQEEEED